MVREVENLSESTYGTESPPKVVKSCPLTKLNGGLSRLHSADEDAVSWLTSYGSRHAYKKTKKTTNSEDS